MDYQQDVDLDKLYMDVAVFNQRVMGPTHAVNVVDMAMRSAYGRRGVSHICIPKDIQEWPVSDKMRSSANIKGHSGDWSMPSTAKPADALLRRAASIINDGSKVAIMVGRGALGAREEVAQLAETVGGPVVKALLGKGVLPDRSPYTTGGIGLLGTAPSVDAVEECDTLILIGSSYPYMEFLPKPGQAKCVQIELDPTRIGLRHQTDTALVGDAKTILQALLPLLKRKDNKFLTQMQERMKTWNELMEERGTRKDMPMKPQVVTYTLNKLLNDDAIISSDSGTIATWTARYVEMRGAMQFSLSGSLATMANGLPYSIGAAIAYPGRQVVCVVGDGGLTMLMGELATLVKYKLRVTVIVIKNNVLGQIKWEQMILEGNPEFGVELQPIDFAQVAEACGARGFTSFNLHDNDKKLIKAAKEKTMEVMHAAGATEVIQEARYAHLVGAARMGADPRTSVVDKFGRTHDIANLFICDGSILPTQGSANPGLTIQALAARTADYLISQQDAVFTTNRRDMTEPPLRKELAPPGTYGRGVPRLI